MAGAYALGRPLGPALPAARGELGRIWSLDTDLGRWALKELWQPMTESAAQNDVAFQQAALEAGIRLPEPRLRPDGYVLARAGDRTVRVYAWADLTSSTPEPPVAGELLGRLHRLDVPAESAPHPWFREPVGRRRWHELVVQAASARVPWAAGVEALIPELLAADTVLPDGPERPQMRCHLDFGPDNVVLDGAGRPTVIDWENSGAEVPERELAMALLDWAPDGAAAASFLDGYASAGGPGRLRDRASFASALAVQGHLLEFYARRALSADASEEDVERSAWRIRAILERPITLARIDAILDA